MRFWDTSAVVPLCVEEPATRVVGELTDADSSLVVWWTTRTECLSAIERRLREGAIHAGTDVRTRRVLEALAESGGAAGCRGGSSPDARVFAAIDRPLLRLALVSPLRRGVASRRVVPSP